MLSQSNIRCMQYVSYIPQFRSLKVAFQFLCHHARPQFLSIMFLNVYFPPFRSLNHFLFFQDFQNLLVPWLTSKVSVFILFFIFVFCFLWRLLQQEDILDTQSFQNHVKRTNRLFWTVLSAMRMLNLNNTKKLQ